MTTTATNVVVAQRHVFLSHKASRVSKQLPIGHFDQTVEPSVEVVADPVWNCPLTLDGHCCRLVLIARRIMVILTRTNTAKGVLAAFLIFWQRGCPRILYYDRGGKLLSFPAHIV